MNAEARSIGVIRTPDQRLRVFVSSTLAELAEERIAVSRAVSALRLTPVLFELGAQSHAPRELYRAYLAQSDIFIGLYWERYGWIGPEMGISGLEDEFRLSVSMPRLIYIKTPASHREARLTAMIEELQTKGTVSFRLFRTPRELGRLVRTDLAVLLSERFAAGDDHSPRPSSPSNATRKLPRSLPVTSTSLIGRGEEVAAISKLVETDGVRLVTLTGPGGIGKTRLAVAVGAQLEAHYAQGAVFVAACEGLVRRYRAGVVAMVRRACGPGAPVDDLSQEPLSLAIAKVVAGEVRDPDRLPGFVAGLARNLAREYWHKSRVHLPDEGLSALAELPVDAPPWTLRSSTAKAVLEHLRLPSRCLPLARSPHRLSSASGEGRNSAIERELRPPGGAEIAVFEFIEGSYNPRRRHSPLAYESPVGYERKQRLAA